MSVADLKPFHLIELVNQVRPSTLQLLENAPASWLTWAPPGTSNHLIWHAGHALWLQDQLGIEPITGQSELPAGWTEKFGMNCHSVAEQKQWPDRAELIDRLTAQHRRLVQIIEANADRLTRSSAPGLARHLIHGLHDEARHQGEMYLLLKLRHRLG